MRRTTPPDFFNYEEHEELLRITKTVMAKKKIVKIAAQKADEPVAEKKSRTKKILAGLHKLYPDATCALEHADAFQLLITTILSAQSTDVTVNKVAPVLFAKYPTPQALAGARTADVEKIIHRTGFFRQKTKSVIGASQTIVERFGGKVPDDLEPLLLWRALRMSTDRAT